MRLSSLALEYVRVPVRAVESGARVDITGQTVTMAFVAPGTDPVAGDWKTAVWETDATTNPDTYYARCLVGPSGTVTLTAGTYAVWVKVTGPSPEVPVIEAGRALTVY